MTAPTRRPARPAVVSAGPKLAARRKADRRRRLRSWARRAGWVALACLPVLLLTWVVLSSPAFDVDRVDVQGATSPELVRDAADVSRGKPLARVDVDGVRERIAALSSVEDVTVRRDWPGTVRITVVERAPVAAVPAAGGGWQLLSSDGTAFATVKTRPRGVVALALPRSKPTADDPTTRAALDVLAEIGPPVRALVSTVRAESPQRVLLAVKGRTVVWGAPGDRAAEKTRTVQVLVTRPGGQIDVASPGVATVTGAAPKAAP